MRTASKVLNALVLSAIVVVALTAPGWAIRPNPDGNPHGTDVLLWHMDNATGGTWTDSASGALGGTGAATSVTGLLKSPVASGLGAATSFPSAGIISPGYSTTKGQEMTVEAWIYWPAGGNPQANDQVIAEQRGTGDFWWLYVNTVGGGGVPGEITFASWGTSAISLSTSGCSFQTGVWYHVAVTVKHNATDNNDVRIYVTPAPAPGVQIGPPVLKGSATGRKDLQAMTNCAFRAGGDINGGPRNFDGYIDEVKVSNVALTLFDSFLAGGDSVYDIYPLSETDLMSLYANMLIDALHYSDPQWHTWSVDPRGGYWGNGSSEMRAMASMIFTCGTLLRYCDSMSSADRANYLAKATAAIRFIVTTHVTGTQNCTDGKKWGAGWQTAYWMGTSALGAWLIWDSLDSELQGGMQRVVAYEADRFLTGDPPGGRWGDTKAEENAWNLTCISSAANMFPSHPHAAAWDQRAIVYAMNTLSVAQDEQDNTIVDGQPVSQWVCTENMHPDFTLENHNIWHPSYMQCSCYMLLRLAIDSTYAGRPVPQGATHHLMDTWGVFKNLLLPSGETIFPQGMDWEMHNLPAINLFGILATYMQDPVAAASEKTILQYMRAWQQWCGGSLTVPGSTLGFLRHAIQAEQAGYGYLAHKLFGPSPNVGAGSQTPPQRSEADSVTYYTYVDDLLHRTQSKLLSFSWKNRFMGMIVPIGAGHEGNPFFTVPITNGFVGSTSLSSGGTTLSTQGRAVRTIPNGCETAGSLVTNGGLLRQDIKVTSLGQKTVVYQDLVTALASVSVTKEQGVAIGIENDSISGGARTLHHKNGATSFDWQNAASTFVIPGTWANVDGRLGVITAMGSPMAYSKAGGYTSGIAVYADVLYGSYSTATRSFQSGDQVAHRVVVLYAEVTPEETAALAASVRIEDTPSGQVLHFGLPEGGEGQVLLSLTFPTVSPDVATLPLLGTQQFAFQTASPPVNWQVVNQSTPGVGTIDSNGLFSAQAVGTCQVRATDAAGNTDDSGTITVVGGPTFSPTTPLRVVRWGTAAFTFSPALGSVTWQVTDESGPAGTVGSVDASGLFTGVGAGTCQVRATDGSGNTGVSGLITVVSPGAYSYVADANTVVLYHFDEAMGNAWVDSSGNDIHASTASTSYPVTHVAGVFGNAAGEFHWETSDSRWIKTNSTTLFQTDEMTAEAWVYFPAGVDIPASTGPIHGIMSLRGGGNTWSLTAGVWDAGLGYGVPGGLTFVFWGTPANEFIWSPQRVFYNEVWCHVAVTVKKLSASPVSYEVKLYATPLGTTTPQLVATKITPNRMTTTSQYLYIGDEGGNAGRKFSGYIDEVRISNRARTPEELSWSLGGIAAPSMSIGQAKSQAADGACVSLTGAISAGFADCCYLEAVNRSAGIGLDTDRPLGLGVGDVGTVAGTLGVASGERFLRPLHAEKTGVLP